MAKAPSKQSKKQVKMSKCLTCGGSGMEESEVKCLECEGKGKVKGKK